MVAGHYQDAPTIPDAADLWRRIPPHHLVRDDNVGGCRISSAAFDDDDDGEPMSVVLAAEARGPAFVLEGHVGYGLAAITAGLARECSQAVARDPLSFPDRPSTPEERAHCVVVGHKPRSIMKKLRNGANWAHRPPGC